MIYSSLRFLSLFLFHLLFRLRVHGLEHLPREGAVLICANHRSLWDPPVLGSIIPRRVHFMAKEELFRLPVLSWLLPRVGVFPVRRGHADRATIRRALAYLEAGEAVVIFPEGRRVRGAKLGEGLPGAAHLAIKGKAPVIPVGIRSTYRLFGPVEIRVGPPIRFDDLTGARLRSDALRQISNERIMGGIAALIGEPSSNSSGGTRPPHAG